MDKKSVIGFILMGLVLVGFTIFQSKQAEQQLIERRKQEAISFARRDSLAAIEAAKMPEKAEENSVVEQKHEEEHIYKDASLDARKRAEGQIIRLANDKLELEINTKGAQLWSARLKDYSNYGGSDLYLFKAGDNHYDVSVYVGEFIQTQNFTFDVASCSDSLAVLRMPFENGGYIEQVYSLSAGSYMVNSELAFVNMTNIPRQVNSIDVDFETVIPRMEKGYKNESQYSKLNYYFTGDKKPLEMGRGRSNAKKIASNLEWFAFQQQFFSMIVRAPGQFSSGDLSVNFLGENADHNLMACNANMRLALNGGGDTRIPLEIYLGPNHYNTLKSYDHQFEKVIPLGGSLVGWFTKYFIIPMFNFLHKYIANFGLIILIMTLIIKIVVLPFTYKSFASSAKMSALRPYIEDINKKYPKQEDALKKQQATMELYKRAGVSAMGGCLPTLLTFPILWAMFRFFPASIELRQQSFLWAEDLSAYDSIVDFGVRVPLLGDHLSLFALLMAVVMWGYSKITMSQQPTSDDPSAKSMQFMSVWMMPIMMFFICNSLSSGLSYYYLVSQLISMVEIFIIRKWCVKPQAVIAKVEASKGKPLPKSKWQQRLEEAQKLQQQQMKQQQRKR
ncbi:MAG: membrane protein insertase YidC [Bacteroidales bacterium]|nr:membrane protein insertase YidC [Bacteroidales bacterium]